MQDYRLCGVSMSPHPESHLELGQLRLLLLDCALQGLHCSLQLIPSNGIPSISFRSRKMLQAAAGMCKIKQHDHGDLQ